MLILNKSVFAFLCVKRKVIKTVILIIISLFPQKVLPEPAFNKIHWQAQERSDCHYKIEINKSKLKSDNTGLIRTYHYSKQNSYDFVFENGFIYQIRVQTINKHGVFSPLSDAAVINSDDMLFSAKNTINTQEKCFLFNNHPNPFNASTLITFSILTKANVKLEIFNIAGQLVETPIDKNFSVGVFKYIWQPSRLPSGTYIYKLSSGQFNYSKKMLYLK